MISEKIQIAALWATGMLGQRFITLLENHTLEGKDYL